MSRRWSVMMGVAASAVVVALAQQPAAPTLVVIAPGPDSVVTGLTKFAAEVRPDTVSVKSVEFVVNGVPACRAITRPFECTWDAGSSNEPRTVRVIAQLSDGQRLVQALRTTGLALSFVASTDAVLVSVHVFDNHGRFVRNLDVGKFRILEDGQSQQITSFGSEDAGVDILVVIDVSDSMTPALGELKAATRGFLEALRPQDTITVATFNTALMILSPRGADAASRMAAIDRFETGGSTALYDAMIRAVGHLKPHGGRRAIVIFTDGDDVASRSTIESARAAFEVDDVVLYMIAQGKAAEDAGLRDRLTSLAAGTGGQAFLATRMSSLKEHFSKIVEELSTQYVLGYTPRKPLGDGGWRRIVVEAGDSGERYRVRARPGYLAVRR